MARKKAAAAKAPPTEENRNGHNSAAIEKASRHLFFHHKRKIKRADILAREARNALGNAKKLANAELSQFDMSYEDIKESFALDAQGGEQVALSKMQRILRIMRWMGFGPGAQPDMFEEGVAKEFVDPFERGVIAALNGDDRDGNPYPAEDMQSHLQWHNGYDAGQSDHIDWQKTRDAEDFDGSPLGGGEVEPIGDQEDEGALGEPSGTLAEGEEPIGEEEREQPPAVH